MIRFAKTYFDLYDFIKSGNRICVNQGGTRSGKTYSILQFLIEAAIKGTQKGMKGQTVTICRKTYPALRATALRDFIEILESIGRYDEDLHNKTLGEYRLGNWTFEFISVDQPQKIRGRKRDILFINEANELDLEDWRQLLLRTTGVIILDYNPSDEYHWIYDSVLTRKDVSFYITNYTNNPHLTQTQIQEIENLKGEDENYWNVYGLGMKGVSGATVYPKWQLCDVLPDGDEAYGLDFGFNVPSALVQLHKNNSGLYCKEVIYQTNLTNPDIIAILKTKELKQRAPIYCDNAEPDRITELQRAGFNAMPCHKDFKNGVDKIRSVPLFITKESINLLKEIKNYKYKIDHAGKPTDDAVKVNDHAMDAMRYGGWFLIADRKLKAGRTTFM